MNKVILLGNVGRDPKMRMVDSSTVAEFPLATSERRRTRDADGREVELPELTEWHTIVIRKGSRLLVEGKLRTRSWEDHNAIKRYITEIYVDTFELLPK